MRKTYWFSNVWYQIINILNSKSRDEPHMAAIIYMAWTKYTCNFDMLSITEIVLKSRDYDFWTYISKTKFWWLQAFCPYWKRLQAYMVRFGFEIASIKGPHCYHDCKHIWSLSYKLLRPYVVESYFCLSYCSE